MRERSAAPTYIRTSSAYHSLTLFRHYECLIDPSFLTDACRCCKNRMCSNVPQHQFFPQNMVSFFNLLAIPVTLGWGWHAAPTYVYHAVGYQSGMWLQFPDTSRLQGNTCAHASIRNKSSIRRLLRRSQSLADESRTMSTSTPREAALKAHSDSLDPPWSSAISFARTATDNRRGSSLQQGVYKLILPLLTVIHNTCISDLLRLQTNLGCKLGAQLTPARGRNSAAYECRSRLFERRARTVNL